jgi:hypothetical protein
MSAPTCAAPAGECGGVCTDLTSNHNCGSCGTSCSYNAITCGISTAAGIPVDCGCTDEGGAYLCD